MVVNVLLHHVQSKIWKTIASEHEKELSAFLRRIYFSEMHISLNRSKNLEAIALPCGEVPLQVLSA